MVEGDSWFIFYNSTGGYLSNMKRMMTHFNLRPKETIIFKMNNTNVIYARIYEEDGKELNYATRSANMSTATVKTWFWNVNCEAESGKNIITCVVIVYILDACNHFIMSKQVLVQNQKVMLPKLE